MGLAEAGFSENAGGIAPGPDLSSLGPKNIWSRSKSSNADHHPGLSTPKLNLQCLAKYTYSYETGQKVIFIRNPRPFFVEKIQDFDN